MDVVIVAAGRSPMGKAGKGQFAETRIDDIAADVLRETLKRVPKLDPKEIVDFLCGCAFPEGEQGMNVARSVALLAGLPQTVGAVTINRYCASSLEAINMAANAIAAGQGEVYVAGGLESMTHVPMGGFNPILNERFFSGNIPNVYTSMGETAENLAKKYKLSRKEQDQFALRSHQRAVQAQQKGWFKEEIVPVNAYKSDGTKFVATVDEGPRFDTSLEKLGQLKPAFSQNGTVTAGNSSQMTDGAACVVLMSAKKAKDLGMPPLAKIRSMGLAGFDPALMGVTPVVAISQALKKAGLIVNDIDLFENNEAFAATALAVQKELKIPEEKYNVHGGAVALGHPLGCSGARLTATILHALKTHDKKIGCVSLCVGGGQAVATVFEKM